MAAKRVEAESSNGKKNGFPCDGPEEVHVKYPLGIMSSAGYFSWTIPFQLENAVSGVV